MKHWNEPHTYAKEKRGYEKALERAYRGGRPFDYTGEPEWGTGSDVTTPYTRWGERGYGYDRVRHLGVREREEPGPYSGRGPAGYKRSDERILEEACERLTRHGQVDARNMQVRVEDGEIILSGSVNDRRVKRMAEDAVESIAGVKDVQNQLRITQDRAKPSGKEPGHV